MILGCSIGLKLSRLNPFVIRSRSPTIDGIDVHVEKYRSQSLRNQVKVSDTNANESKITAEKTSQSLRNQVKVSDTSREILTLRGMAISIPS